MAYELFKRTAIRISTPTVAVTPQGRVIINAAAVRILVEAGVKSVLLLWDRATNKMAIKAAPKGDKNAYAVSFTSKSSGSLRAKAFWAYIGWSAPRRETLPAVWNEMDKMLEVALPPQYVGSAKSAESRRKVV
jgi:hypothetical protein